MELSDSIIERNEPILVTGAGGFIGSHVLTCLRERGYENVRALVRLESGKGQLSKLSRDRFLGNLLVREDCLAATRGVKVIYHLAAGTGTKSFADAFMNSVVTTRNLIEAALQNGGLRRFVNVSSFAVYTNQNKTTGDLLDESCPTEENPELRGDPYCFAKVKQDQLVLDYGAKRGLPYVLVRPGVVYGIGKQRIHGRVGLDTFGIFLHLGGGNRIPFTHVENCADAIVLAGLKKGVEGEVFNIVDDDLPTSREFLRLYKRRVRHFRSVYVPHAVSYFLCYLWEKYSAWSQGQLPPIHNRKEWAAAWKPTRYSNDKIKSRLNWNAKVSTREGLEQFFAHA